MKFPFQNVISLTVTQNSSSSSHPLFKHHKKWKAKCFWGRIVESGVFQHQCYLINWFCLTIFAITGTVMTTLTLTYMN